MADLTRFTALIAVVVGSFGVMVDLIWHRGRH